MVSLVGFGGRVELDVFVVHGRGYERVGEHSFAGVAGVVVEHRVTSSSGRLVGGRGWGRS